MSYKPFVSVVIPTYNRVEKLNAAIESALGQTYSNFEVIVIDDGSVDTTGGYIRHLARQSRNGPQVHYFFQFNQGPSVARNRGIAEARGEWIAFLDSDNIWSTDKLECQIRAVEIFKDVCGACITGAKLVNDSEIETTSYRDGKRLFTQAMGLAPNVVEHLANSIDQFCLTSLLVRADLVRQVEGFDPGFQFCEVLDFSFRLALVTSFCYVNRPLVLLDRSAPSESSDKRELRFLNRQMMLEQWLSMDAELPLKVQKLIVQHLQQTQIARAHWYHETGRFIEAKCMFGRITPTLARRVTPKVKAYTA